jgi:hypothetical protein
MEAGKPNSQCCSRAGGFFLLCNPKLRRYTTLHVLKKLETKDWSMRLNLSVFAMIVIDTWLVYSAIKNTPTIELNQKEFYSFLAEELIDNTYGNRGPPLAV